MEKTTDITEKPLATTNLKQTNLFWLHYKPKGRPVEDLMIAYDFNSARKTGIEYCNKHNIHFVSVRPAIIDLTRMPRNPYSLHQQEAKEKKSE